MGNTIILGANGLIGRKLTPKLRDAGIEVKTAGRTRESDIYFDWDDQNTFAPAMTGVKSLYLVPPAMVADAAAQVEGLLDAARKAGVAHIVAVSSLGVTFPTEPMESGRHRYEKAVMASGLDWALLRPSGFMQNFSEGFMMPAIRQAGVIAAAAGSGKVAMVDSADIAAVALALLTQEDCAGQIVEITGPQAHDFAEIAAMITAASGRSIAYQPVSHEQMSQMMRGAGVPDDYADLLLRDQQAIHDGHAAVVTTTVRDITGREPVGFDEFVRANAVAWR